MRGNNNNNNNNLSNNSNNNNNNMEQSFYEDSAQFTPVTAASNAIKRPHTLDLNSKPQAKKQRITQTPIGTTPLILNSPDLQLLKFNTPELEKFIMANNSLQTPTPSLVFPTKVTSEQEDYAKGFVDALNSLHNSENSQVQIVSVSGAPSASAVTTSAIVVNTSNNISTVAGANINSSSMSGGSITYTNLDESFPVAIKDEPQTVPNSPPLSPIDMETQERIKLERKRQRNRVAASKCRKRKLERISKLEDKVKMLKGENTDLASVIKQLKEHVFTLKQQVIDHINAGCNVTLFNNAVLQTK